MSILLQMLHSVLSVEPRFAIFPLGNVLTKMWTVDADLKHRGGLELSFQIDLKYIAGNNLGKRSESPESFGEVRDEQV